MATIVTRAGKGSPLTNNELDANFVNLNDAIGTGGSTVTPATINGVTGVSSSLADVYSNRQVIEARDYGIVTGSAAAAADNTTKINNLMAGLAARGGGILQLPPGDIYIASTLDNKYPRVQVWGAGTDTLHDSGSPTFGTRLIATIATTMLKLRTPYAAEQGVPVANTWKYTGGGFKYLSLNGDGVATKALLIDSVSFAEVDLFATNFNAAEFYTIQCGITLAYDIGGNPINAATANLGEACDVQFSKITLRARAIDTPADKAATICRLIGSNNANVSLNRLPDYGISIYAQHWNGNVLTADSADNNDIALIGIRAGGTGYLAYMKGPTYNASTNPFGPPVGADGNTFNYVVGGGAIYAEGTGTAGVTAGVKNRIVNFDNGNGTQEPTAGTGSSWAFTRVTDNVRANEPTSKLAIADYPNDAGSTLLGMGSESLRIRNTASNHIRLTDTISEWGINIDGNNGNLRFNRVAGTGTIDGLVASVAGRSGAVVLTSADSSHIATGTGASSTTVQAKLRQTVSIKDFGATGDGTTDDTTAIQNAINSGAGIVNWPAGTYMINSTGLTGANNQIWQGASSGATIVKLSANVAGAYFIQWVGKSKWSVQDITFDLNGFTSLQFLDINTSNDWIIANCRFLKMTTFGWSLNGCNRFVLRDNYIEMTTISHLQNQSLLVGNSAGATTDGKIIGNTSVNSGFDIMGSNHLFQGNTIRGFGFGGGFTIEEDVNTYDLIIDSNVITGGSGQDESGGSGTGTWTSGIENWSPRCIISNNTIFNNDGSGIDNGGSHSVIDGNLIYNNGRGAAGLVGITSRQSGAVFLNNGSFSVISNNRVYDTSVSTFGQLYGYQDEPKIYSFTGNGTVGNSAGPFVWGGTGQIYGATYDGWKPIVTLGGTIVAGAVTGGTRLNAGTDYTLFLNASQSTMPGGYIVFTSPPGVGVAVYIETSPIRFVTLTGNNFRSNRTAPTRILGTGIHGNWPTVHGSLTYNPPSCPAGGYIDLDIFCYAARVGDYTQVSFSLDQQGLIFSGYVNVNNNVRLRMSNPTASAVDLGLGTFRAMCTKPENYTNI